MQIKLPNAIMSVEKMYSETLSQSDGKYLLSILPVSIEASFAGFYSHSLPRRLYSHSPQLYSWIAEFRFQVEPLFLCQTHVMAMWRGHLPDCFGLIQWSSSVFQVPHFANQSRIRSHSVEWITRFQTEYTQHQYIKNPELIWDANNKYLLSFMSSHLFAPGSNFEVQYLIHPPLPCGIQRRSTLGPQERGETGTLIISD